VRTRQFIGAGHMIAVLRGGPSAVRLEPGTLETAGKPLAPGTSYQARVYVPRPSDRQLRTAGTDYPEFVNTTCRWICRGRRRGPTRGPVRFAPWGSHIAAGADFLATASRPAVAWSRSAASPTRGCTRSRRC
jgi:hypothetical protein